MNAHTAPTRREGWGHILITTVVAMAIVIFITYAAFAIAIPLGWFAQPEGRVATFLSGAGVAELLAFGGLLWYLRRRDSSLRDLGWNRPTTGWAILLGVAVALIYGGITVLSNPRIGLQTLLIFSWLRLLAVIVAIIAGVFEETLFRGYIMTGLERLGSGRVAQVLISGLLFGLAHPYGFTNPISMLSAMSFTFLLGVAFAIVYLVGRRSLTPVIIGHVLTDLIIEPWLLLSIFSGA